MFASKLLCKNDTGSAAQLVQACCRLILFPMYTAIAIALVLYFFLLLLASPFGTRNQFLPLVLFRCFLSFLTTTSASFLLHQLILLLNFAVLLRIKAAFLSGERYVFLELLQVEIFFTNNWNLLR